MILFFLFLFFPAQAQRASKNLNPGLTRAQIGDQVEQKEQILQEKTLSDLFRKNNCAAIIKYAGQHDFKKLSNLELAIYAYCEPPEKDSEKIFAYAEKNEPDNDFILLLHARYQWKKYILTARDLWKKLAARAKDERIAYLASQYLDEDFQESNEIESTASHLLILQVGGLFESNPDFLADSDPDTSKKSSPGTLAGIALVSRSEVNFGFSEWLANLTSTNYSTLPEADISTFDLAATFAIQTSYRRFFILKPFGNFTALGGKPLNQSIGGSVGQMWQFLDSDLQFLFTSYADRYLQAGLEQQQGTHYRIELIHHYQWQESYFIFASAAWERSNEGKDVDTDLLLPYGNVAWNGSFGFERKWKTWQSGVNIVGNARYDDSDSQYLDSEGVPTVKRRQDFSTNVQPWISKKFVNHFELLLYYTFIRTRSNMGQTDTVDRNISDSTTGIILKGLF